LPTITTLWKKERNSSLDLILAGPKEKELKIILEAGCKNLSGLLKKEIVFVDDCVGERSSKP